MHQYQTEYEPLVISKGLIDTLLKQEYPSECIALYTFYYYTAKWQKTNQVKATTEFTAKGLKWKADKVRKVKKILKDLGLVEDIKTINKTTRKVEGWYIKVNFVWKAETVNNQVKEDKTTLPQNPEGGISHTVENGGANALSANSRNALSSNNKNIKKGNSEKFSEFKENPLFEVNQNQKFPSLTEEEINLELANFLIDKKQKTSFISVINCLEIAHEKKQRKLNYQKQNGRDKNKPVFNVTPKKQIVINRSDFNSQPEFELEVMWYQNNPQPNCELIINK